MALNTLGVRLKEERQRLGLSQRELAALGGVKRLSQGHYESGFRFPAADYLFRLSKVGIEVLYVLTGARANSATPAPGIDAEFLRRCMELIESESISRGVDPLDTSRMAIVTTLVYNRSLMKSFDPESRNLVAAQEASSVMEVVGQALKPSRATINTGIKEVDGLVAEWVKLNVRHTEIFVRQMDAAGFGDAARADLGDPRRWPARERAKAFFQLLAMKLVTFESGRLAVIDRARCSTWLQQRIAELRVDISAETKGRHPKTAARR